MNLEASGEEEESSMTPEHVKHVIDDCKKLLVPDAETILGAWGLIDADPSYVSPHRPQCWLCGMLFVLYYVTIELLHHSHSCKIVVTCSHFCLDLFVMKYERINLFLAL